MGNAAILGLPLHVLTDEAFGVAGGTPTNLDNYDAWRRGRCDTADPRLSYFYCKPTMPLGYYGPTVGVGGVGVGNHTLSLGATARSILLSAGATGYAPARVLPSGVTLAGIFSAGAHTDIDDDPFDIDASAVLTSGTGSGTLTVDFASPASPPVAGADMQLARVTLTYTGVVDTFNVQVRDGTTVIANWDAIVGGVGPVPGSGDVLLIPFDAADLLTADGSGVNVRISGDVTSGVLRIEAVDWLCDSGLSAGSILGDTGWLPATQDRYSTGMLTATGAVGQAQQSFVHDFGGTNITGVEACVTYWRDPLNTNGFVDIGRYGVGPVLIPEIDIPWGGDLVGLRARDIVNEMESGSPAFVKRETVRAMRLALGMLTIAEAENLHDRLRRAGLSQPFFISQRRGSSVEAERINSALYCHLTSLPKKGAVQWFDRRTIEIEVEEM